MTTDGQQIHKYIDSFTQICGEEVLDFNYSIPSVFEDDDDVHERKTFRIGDGHGIDCTGGTCSGGLVDSGAQFCVFCDGGHGDGSSTCIPT